MPTSKTGERLMKIETDIGYIKDDLSLLRNDMKGFIDTAHDKFADKCVESELKNIRTDVDGVKLKIAYYVGGAAVLMVVIDVILKIILG